MDRGAPVVQPSRPHVLIVVQNLPVPLDRRVWLECQALTDDGFEVSVICPKGPGDPAYEVLEGVHLYKYRPPPEAEGPLGYLLEFGYCWLRTAWLSLRVARRRPFEVLQACNPPDTYWVLGRLWKRRGARFLFDHHDLNPEIFVSRFGEPTSRMARAQLRILRWLERQTFRTADHVISTNESYRSVAIERGGVEHARTTVVRSGPDTDAMRPIDPVPALRHGRDHLIVYLGIMGHQDGVDLVVRAMHHLVRVDGRDDIHLALLGFGDCFDDLVALADELGIADHVIFTGRADRAMVADYLSTAAVGLSPDPLNPFNDASTMNKTMEYLAFGLPVVAFDLRETRVSAGDVAVYVDPNGAPAELVAGFAKAIAALIDDEPRRARLAVEGRRRAETLLDWRPQRAAYVQAMNAIVRRQGTAPAAAATPSAAPTIDLREPAADPDPHPPAGQGGRMHRRPHPRRHPQPNS